MRRHHRWVQKLKDRRIGLWFGFSLAVYVALFALGAHQALTDPHRNWDMVPYVGAALSIEESDPKTIHARTMGEIKQVVWKDYYLDISEKNSLSSKPAALYQQLPMYTVKPLYVGLVYALGKLGITSYAEATWVVSAMCFLLIGLLLALWRPVYMNPGAWLMAVAALMFIGRRAMFKMGGLSTPDALLTLLILLMLYMLIERRSVLLFGVMGMLAIAARPDALILVLGAIVMLWMARDSTARIDGKMALLLVIIAVATCFGIKYAMDGYSWQRIFYYSFWYKSPYPADMPVDLTFGKYWLILERALGKMTTDVRLLPMLFISAVSVVCYYLYPKARRIWPWVMALAWICYLVRFIMYPSWYDYRYYYVHFLIVLRAAAEMIPPYATVLWERLNRHREALRKELQ